VSKDSDRVKELQKLFSGLASRLVVVSGPSAGAGKGKVLDELLDMASEPLWKSVSVTTRQPRPGEVLHHKYIFVDKADFERREAAGDFLEANGLTVGNRYGTPLAPILEHLSRGDIVILEIEVNGAQFVHEVAPGALFVFIKPTDGGLDEDIAELRRRIEKRGTEDAAVIDKRLEQAAGELRRARELGIYDQWIVNVTGKSEEAAGRLRDLIRGHVGR
jgi:guanylate kinase